MAMKWVSRPKYIFVSPWLLAAATGLLVLIVVTFAVSNVKREKRLMTNAMLQKAATLIRVIRSGARASSISDIQRGMWQLDPWSDHVQRVIDHLSDDPDLHFLAVVDRSGVIMAHSRQVMKGRTLQIELPFSRNAKSTQGPLVYKILQEKGQARFFVVVRSFQPFQPAIPPVPFSLRPHGRFTVPGSSNPTDPLPPNQASKPSNEYYVIVALDMKEYDRALGRLYFQMVMLSFAMLLVGVGGWLSLAAVQGYRVSQKTLHEIQAFTGLLVSKLPVGIVATDKRGIIATWNQSAEELIGIKQNAAIGKKPADILPQVLSDFFSVPSTGQAIGSDRVGCEIQLIVHEKEVVVNCHHLIISGSAGEFEGKVLLLSNMTELKNLEKKMRENERLAAVGRMAAGVAHEVRNPLSSIKGLTLLLQGKFSQRSSEHETAMLLIQEVERMNRTISELLSFSRPAPLELSKVDICNLLERQVRLLAADTASDGITCELELADDLQAVAADQDRLNQVLLNIILNSMQAMSGGGELTVRAWNNRDNGTVIITFTDTGTGMDTETMNQAFFPYFTTKKNGSGIGLAISQKVIADHGGTILLDSEQGKGTVVTVELPQYNGGSS